MRALIVICWIVTGLATLVAALIAVPVLLSGEASAPQQGAAGAMACALAIIPYVFTRAIEGMAGAKA
jgi:hypothetical protein